jgi:hypothetical protein
MMNSMQEKVLGWIGKDSPLVADNIVPPVAMMPEAKPMTDEDKRLATIATAHVYVEQLRQERDTDRAEIEALKTSSRMHCLAQSRCASRACSNSTSLNWPTTSRRCKPTCWKRTAAFRYCGRCWTSSAQGTTEKGPNAQAKKADRGKHSCAG